MDQRILLAAATAQGEAIAQALNEASFVERYMLSDERVARYFMEKYLAPYGTLEQHAFRAGFFSRLKVRVAI